MTRHVAIVIGGAASVFVALQFVGPARVNPAADPVVRLEAHARVPPSVAGLLRRACYDCHSDETRWPWYSRVAPVSWFVVRDVVKGRGQMNFSRWGEYNAFDRADMLDEACELASKREMPIRPYRLLHPEARLSDGDVADLCTWTSAEARRLAGGS